MGKAAVALKESPQKEEKIVKIRKSNRPENYDFSKCGEPDGLTVTRAGKQKKAAKQLREVIAFAKQHKLSKITRVTFNKKITEFQKTVLQDSKHPDHTKNREKYPQIAKSVQEAYRIVDHYWGHLNQMKQVGVVGS